MSNSSSVINIVAFILATIGYYFALAPKLTIQEIDNKQHMNKYFNHLNILQNQKNEY